VLRVCCPSLMGSDHTAVSALCQGPAPASVTHMPSAPFLMPGTTELWKLCTSGLVGVSGLGLWWSRLEGFLVPTGREQEGTCPSYRARYSHDPA
jgi:hypothetical protein